MRNVISILVSRLRAFLGWLRWGCAMIIAIIGIIGIVQDVIAIYFLYSNPKLTWGLMCVIGEGMAFCWLGLTLAYPYRRVALGRLLGLILWGMLFVYYCEASIAVYYGAVPIIDLTTTTWLIGFITRVLLVRLIVFLVCYFYRTFGKSALLALSPLFMRLFEVGVKSLRRDKRVEGALRFLGERLGDVYKRGWWKLFISPHRYKFVPWVYRPPVGAARLPTVSDYPIPQIPSGDGDGTMIFIIAILIGAVVWIVTGHGPTEW